jgi:hypothetical protein
MMIEEFAIKHRIHTRTDSCGETIIPGKPRKARHVEDRRHIFEFGDGTFGLSYTQPVPDPASVRKYNNAQRRLLAAGFIQTQDGEHEGVFTFNPEDARQAKLAIAACGVKKQKVFSPEQIEAATAKLASLRRAAEQRPLSDLESRPVPADEGEAKKSNTRADTTFAPRRHH